MTQKNTLSAFFAERTHRLIQILREQVNDSATLNLIRKYLKVGVMEQGLVKATKTGVPQGGLCRAQHNEPCGVPSFVGYRLLLNSNPLHLNRLMLV